MSMRRTLAELENRFVEEAWVDRARAEETVRRSMRRQRTRRLERQHKHGTIRFGVLVVVLLATAVLVTIAMFETLYYVMG
jgi:hypothetical protein